jgi:hypothetical protein
MNIYQCPYCGEQYADLNCPSCDESHNEELPEDDDGYCTACSGTGEGQYEGSSCSSCGGKGHVTGKPDPDDYDPPESDDAWIGPL